MEQLQRLHSNCRGWLSWMESPGSSPLLLSRGPRPGWQQGHLLSGAFQALPLDSVDVWNPSKGSLVAPTQSVPWPGWSGSHPEQWLSRVKSGALAAGFSQSCCLPGCALDRSSAAYLVCSPSDSPCLIFISSGGLFLLSVVNKNGSRKNHFRMWFHIYHTVSSLCRMEVISLLLSVFPLLLKKKGWDGGVRCCSSHKFVFCKTLPRIRQVFVCSWQ